MFKKVMQSGYKLFIQFILLSISCALMASTVWATSNMEGIQVYQKNLHASPEHRQKLADDITRYRNADNLWDVLREEFSLPHYENNAAVQEKIEWFMNNQDFLLRSASRAAPYLYYILQQVKKRHLPAEMVLLPIIESGYNPFNVSNVGAAGIWQLMPDTATGLGVKQNWSYDGRRDIIASTRAALNYLAYLQSFFEGNWLYAIAAYNTGEGNVLAAIRKNIRDGKDTDFWSLPVAQQTKDYVPSLLALAVIISHPDQYPVYFPPVRNAPYLAQVDVGAQINLKYAALLAGMSYKKLTQLNPAFSRSSSDVKGPSKLVLPIENVEQFTENLARSPLNTTIRWLHYKVKVGDNLASIAKKFNVAVSAIRKMNHLSSKTNLRHGANILIPYTGEIIQPEADTTTELADNQDTIQTQPLKVASSNKSTITAAPIIAFNSSEKYTLQPGDTVYMVRSEDTVDSIAQHFHVNAQALQMANQLNSKIITAGKQLIIPTHATEFASSSPSSSANLQPGDTLYMVRRGDTIEKIASKFRTTPSAIRVANLMGSNTLQEGDRLVIPTHMTG